MKTINVLGMDYGASNGRAMIGRFDGRTLAIEELHRFQNRPVTAFSSTYWNILGLFGELKNALIKSRVRDIPLASIGIDSWGIDFGILDSQGNLLGNPHCYRDSRTCGIPDEAYRHIPEYEVFARSGMCPIQIGTLFQLLAMMKSEIAFLESGKTLLFIPNILGYFLTGNISCDATMASTSLLYSPFAKGWIDDFRLTFGLPDILPNISQSGGIIGRVNAETANETGVGNIPVIAVAHHDTASAIAAVPAPSKQDVIYISCGTWSVVGTTVGQPIVNQNVLRDRFNNEIGCNGEIMFVKNLTGLWILQECARDWAGEGYALDYDLMEQGAVENSDNDHATIDTDAPVFAEPGNMAQKIADDCRKNGQVVPESKEDVYRCIMYSLASKYRESIGQVEKLTGRNYKKIHIIGGGSRSRLLCGFTAKLTGMDVIAGPYEATAIGNMLAQLMSLREIRDMSQGTEIISQSFPLAEYR